VHTWEDGGARWTDFTSNASGGPTGISEYTVAQGSGQYVYSSRVLAYSGKSVTSIS
jgi:hypothetical protein